MVLLQIIIEGVRMRFESDCFDLLVIVGDLLTGRGQPDGGTKIGNKY